MKNIRRDMQIIFQDPFASLNPRMTISETIGESLLIQKIYTRKQAYQLRKRVLELMDFVGLSPRLVTSTAELEEVRSSASESPNPRPHPTIIVCDEPVSAFDVLHSVS
jgi:peptide/nickel transport system ATP-binding protein